LKFSTVEIKPDLLDPDKWSVSFSDLDGDRHNEGIPPSSLGFWHYPRKLGREKAFNTLKTHMIERHVKEIEMLSKSLSKLVDLKMPEGY
jgi:hypothetical protein